MGIQSLRDYGHEGAFRQIGCGLVICCVCLIGCTRSNEDFRALGFETEAEMRNAFSLGYRTKARMLEAERRPETAAGSPSKYPRCAGSYEKQRCEAEEAKLAAESDNEKNERAERLRAAQQSAAEQVAAAPLTESPQEHATSSASGTPASPYSRISVSALHRLVATGMSNYKPYQVRTKINGKDAFEDRLCDHVRYDGFCERGMDSVRVELDLHPLSRRQVLYDIRGRTGGEICATVEMRPDGLVYLTDYAAGGCP